MRGIVANCLTNKNQGVTELDIVEYPLRGWSVTGRTDYRQKTRTESGMNISNAFNPSSQTSIGRSVGR